MKFDPKYFIGLAHAQGMAFERHGDTVSYSAKEVLSAKLGLMLVNSARNHLDDLLEFLPDQDQPAFQMDLFKNL